MFFYPQAEPAAEVLAPKRRGGQGPGESHPRAKLTERQVIEIKRRLASGEGNSEIARYYGVSTSTIGMIKTGRSWSHVQPQGCDLTTKLRASAGRLSAGHAANACLCEDQVRAIKRSLAGGQSVASIARDYGVDYQVIYSIKRNNNWRHVRLED